MKIQIVGLFVCMLLITTILPIPVMAGSEEDPELEDYNENEANDLFGLFARVPGLFTVFQKIGIFTIDSLDVIDIQSAWFYERSDEPEYLFTALKLQDFLLIRQTQTYTIRWTFERKEYSTSLKSDMLNGIHTWFMGGSGGLQGIYEEINGSFDFEKHIIYFAVPKRYIGDPQPGDVLTETNAWTALRFGAEPITVFFGGELAKDWSGYGKEYIIQY